MKGELEHLGAFPKDLTPFHSPGMISPWIWLSRTLEFCLLTLPNVLFEEQMTRGRAEGWKEQGEADGKRWKRLLQPRLRPPAHVRHPGEQHRGAREPSQRVPELTWLPRWWQQRWTLRARRSSLEKIPVPAAAPKRRRAPKGHEQLLPWAKPTSQPSLEDIVGLGIIFYPLQVVTFHPATIKRRPKLFYPVWKQFPTSHIKPSFTAQPTNEATGDAINFTTPGFHPSAGFKMFSQTKLWPRKS